MSVQRSCKLLMFGDYQLADFNSIAIKYLFNLILQIIFQTQILINRHDHYFCGLNESPKRDR